MPNIWKNNVKKAASAFVFPVAQDLMVDDDLPFMPLQDDDELSEELSESLKEEQDESPKAEEKALSEDEQQLNIEQQAPKAQKQRETPEVTAARLRSEVQAVVNQVAKSGQTHGGVQKSAAAEINFATVQANEIIANAKKSAQEAFDEKIESAQKQIDEQMEKAQKEGYQSGYEAGLKLGEMKAKTEMQTQLSAQVKQFMQKETKVREELIENTKSQLTDISIAVAEKIMQISLKSSKEVITRMISVAIEKLKRREWVRIYVAESDAAELVQASPELRAALTGLSDNVKIVPMQDDEPGTCIIEMPDEIIDASVSSQLKTIRDIIQE